MVTSHKGSRGFTLVELCVVMALLGILALLGVASYGGLKERTADHTAEKQLYNIQESFLHAKSMAEAGGILTDTTFSIKLDGSDSSTLATYLQGKMAGQLPELTGKYTVEATGKSGVLNYTIRYNANSKTYLLSQDGTVSIVSGGTLGDQSTMDKLVDIIKESLKVTQVDSNAVEASPTSNTQQVVAKLKAAGFDLAAMGATTWQYTKDNLFYWTPVDIHDLALTAQVPVMRYNLNTGTYTVWIASIEDRTMDKDHPIEYRALNSYSGYAPSTNNDKGNQTYSQMITRFNEAMKKYGYTT